MLHDIGGVAALSNYTLSIIYKPGKGHKDADALCHIRWPEAMELDSQTAHAILNFKFLNFNCHF